MKKQWPLSDTDFRLKTNPIPAVLYVDGVGYDVLIIRERRGGYQVRLPDDADPTTKIVLKGNKRHLTPKSTRNVPKSMVELKPPIP